VESPICLSRRLMWRSLTSIPSSFAKCFLNHCAVH
jgi:hypothetical protein